MPSACRATWAAGATGGRTCSTARRFRRPRVSPGWHSPVSPHSTCWKSDRCLTASRLRRPGETQHAVMERGDAARDRPAPRHAARAALLQRGRMADARLRSAGRIVPQPPDARRFRSRRWSTTKWRTTAPTAIAMPDCRRCRRLGVAVCKRSTRKRRCTHGVRFHAWTRPQQDALLTAMQRGELTGSCVAGHELPTVLPGACAARHRQLPITRTRQPGTR